LNKFLQERVLILEASRGEGARWRRMPADRALRERKRKNKSAHNAPPQIHKPNTSRTSPGDAQLSQPTRAG
jgi:hypothetical protein